MLTYRDLKTIREGNRRNPDVMALLRLRYKDLDAKGRLNVDMWLDNEPEVATAYWAKEAFYDIYDAPNRAEGGKLLDE